MYQLLIDIHNFKQLSKIARPAMQALVSDLTVITRMVGADFRDIGQGRSLVGFQIHRPSDTAFVVDSVFRIFDFFTERRKVHAGFTLILESGSADEEGERQLKQLLICATENECLWLGPQAAAALSQYIFLEHSTVLWKALSRNSSQTLDLNITQELLHKYCPRDELRDQIEHLRRNLTLGPTSLAVQGDPADAVGDLINDIIGQQLGPDHHRSFLWFDGQNLHDPAPIALTRSLFSIPEQSITAQLTEAEALEWTQVRSFMFQNAHSSIPEVSPAGISLEYPLELFRLAWKLYIKAFCRHLSQNSLALYIHVENYALFNAEARLLLKETIEQCRSALNHNCVIIYSSAETDDFAGIGDELLHFSLPVLQWPDLENLGIRSESLPVSLAFCRKLHTISRRQAANIGFLLTKMVGVPVEPGQETVNYTQKSQIDRAILLHLFESCDELAREVYYAIVITYGLLPVSLIFDFLSYLAVERIRHPAIIQNLYRHGLIRDEELVVPSYPHCGDILEQLLEDRALRIRQDLEAFLSTRLVKGNLAFRLDVFVLMAEIANPDHFFDICFYFAQELLNVNNLETATYVLDYASAHLLNLSDQTQKNRLVHAISYLNCRSLLLQSRQSELQLAFSHLNQLPELNGQWISAYVQLQKARVNFFGSDIEQSLIIVKRAVMQFQDANDRVGLAAAHILFGQILLAKERLIEARDYFILARNNATSRNAVYEDVHAGFYDIVVVFMLGYHSRALEALSDKQGILELAKSNGLYSHATYLEFLRGRVWFELGAYHEARDSFTESAKLSQEFPNPEAYRLCQRWIARCSVFLQDFERAEPIFSQDSDNNETRLFMAESLIVQNKWEEALVILSDLTFANSQEIRLQPERIDWSSGFANLEGKVFLAINQQDCLENIAICYRAYCLGKTNPGSSDAIDALFAFTRNPKRSLQDPYNFLYYFLYCQTLKPATEGNIDDYATILGKSVKFIQERSSRIEDPGHKQSFLRSAWWNRLLLQDARQHNLA